MRSKLALIAFTALAAGCQHTPQDLQDRGVAAVNVPVVTRADYVFDAAAPDGSLPMAEQARLDAWFSSLGLGYGDTIYVEGPYSEAARSQVSGIAARYGILVADGAPVVAGQVNPGSVRVIVSRTRAQVAGCPNWSVPAQPNYNNRSMPNFGCAVNSNLAAMVADPRDLLHGREGASVVDVDTASKAVDLYRQQAPTGTQGLKETTTKGSK